MHRHVTLNLLLKSYNHYYIKNTLLHLSKTIQGWSVSVMDFKYIPLPDEKHKITLLKSPHVHKKSREQFELIKKKSCIQIKTNTQKKATLLLLLINQSTFPGVEIKCNIKYHTCSTSLYRSTITKL